MSSLKVQKFYWLPHCSTCIKAEQYLLDKGIEIQKHINVKAEKVSREELEHLSQVLGGVEKLFPKRSMKYRAWGLHEKELTDEDMLEIHAGKSTFIRRPVLLSSDGQVFG